MRSSKQAAIRCRTLLSCFYNRVCEMLTTGYEVNLYVQFGVIFVFKVSIKLYGRASRECESVEVNRFAAVRSKLYLWEVLILL